MTKANLMTAVLLPGSYFLGEQHTAKRFNFLATEVMHSLDFQILNGIKCKQTKRHLPCKPKLEHLFLKWKSVPRCCDCMHAHSLNMNSSSDSFNTDLTSEEGKSI